MKCIIGQKNDLLRETLKNAILSIKPSADVVECATWDCALLDMIKKGDADFLFLDLNVLGTSWIQRADDLMELHDKAKVVLTGESIDSDVLLKRFEVGISGFIPHHEFDDKLQSILSLIFHFGVYVPPFFVKQPKNDRLASDGSKFRLPNGETLTKRQLEVLFYLKEGYFNKQIAAKLNVKEPTVKLHIHSLFQKLNATNRTQIVIKAHQLGLF